MLNLVITLVIVLLCFIHKGHACHVHGEAFLLDGDVVIGCQDDHVETSSRGSKERRMPGEESWESGNMSKMEMKKKKVCRNDVSNLEDRLSVLELDMCSLGR